MHRLFFLASLLAVPLALLLFAQWPLREVVQAYSRQANDWAQIVFAVYVAVAITAASMANTHLAAARSADGFEKKSSLQNKPDPRISEALEVISAGLPRWRAWALAACLLPWAAFTLWAAVPQILASLKGLEKFGDTLTPGFFLIKLALGLLLALVLLDVLLRLRSKPGPEAALPAAPKPRRLS